jgi:hypothetical protein
MESSPASFSGIPWSFQLSHHHLARDYKARHDDEEVKDKDCCTIKMNHEKDNPKIIHFY